MRLLYLTLVGSILLPTACGSRSSLDESLTAGVGGITSFGAMTATGGGYPTGGTNAIIGSSLGSGTASTSRSTTTGGTTNPGATSASGGSLSAGATAATGGFTATGGRITAISAGIYHTCAVLNGGVQCWGFNESGQLGNGSIVPSRLPARVANVTSGTTAVAAGYFDTCALVNDGVQCWGANQYGQLCSSSPDSSLVPVQVQELSSGVTAVSLGSQHVCALVGGGMKCWGYNDYGQLGNGSKSYDTFTDGYADIYQQHLPLFVSADSMMDAVHRSYDHILEYLEIEALDPTLVTTLSGLQAGLPSSTASTQTKADLDVYLAVAAALLNGTAPATLTGGDVKMVQTLVSQAIAASGMANITLFGYPRVIDFSTFTPRGHYTDSTLLQQYFRAMIWLGSIDFRLIETLASGSQIFHRPQFDAMIAVSDLFDVALHQDWSTLHTTVSTLVGADDSMTIDQVPALEAALGVTSSAGLASLDDATIAQAIVAGRFGTQRIDSYILMADPHAGTLPLNSSFLLFGQRFTVDSYVLSNVVYDRVNHPGFSLRMMPKPLDAAFAAMGNDDALPLLNSDLETYGYAPELATMRTTIDSETSDYWNSSLYNLWLNTLRALSPTPSTVSNPTATGLPSVVGTTAWGRRTLNTQLGSWAQLRHDNVLYVKPAESTGVNCQFPSAYVEPNVAFWDALLQYADTGSKLIAGLSASLQAVYAVTQGAAHFTNLHDDVTLLRQMAIQQTTGADLTSAQLAFINQAVSLEYICGGGVQANGWYPQLIVLGQPTEYNPTIADVFTDPNSGSVLEIGTGSVNPMVVTVETCMGPRAFVGLSLSYYEMTTSNLKRMTDTQWQATLGATPAPALPTWMAPVVAQ